MKRKITYITLILAGILLVNDSVLAAGFTSSTRYTVCGIENVPENIPMLTSGLYNLIKILVPIILVVMGMIDFLSAVSAGDEDQMKKARKRFITRTIAAFIIFFVTAIVQFVFNRIDFDDKTRNDFTGCMNCILSKNCVESYVPDNKSCLYYSIDDCPSIDSLKNACYKDTDNNRCTFKCNGLSEKNCVTMSIEGYCIWNGSSCIQSRDYTKKKCTDYDYRTCPKSDDYGNICKAVDSNKTDSREKKKGECLISQAVTKKHCSNYTNQDGCEGKVDEYTGKECTSPSNGNRISACVEKKHCSEYTNKDGCQGKKDDYTGEQCESSGGNENSQCKTPSQTTSTSTPTSNDTSSNTSSNATEADNYLSAHCSGICAKETVTAANTGCQTACKNSCNSKKEDCYARKGAQSAYACFKSCYTVNSVSQTSPATNTTSNTSSTKKCSDLSITDCEKNNLCNVRRYSNESIKCVAKSCSIRSDSLCEVDGLCRLVKGSNGNRSCVEK